MTGYVLIRFNKLDVGLCAGQRPAGDLSPLLDAECSCANPTGVGSARIVSARVWSSAARPPSHEYGRVCPVDHDGSGYWAFVGLRQPDAFLCAGICGEHHRFGNGDELGSDPEPIEQHPQRSAWHDLVLPRRDGLPDARSAPMGPTRDPTLLST